MAVRKDRSQGPFGVPPFRRSDNRNLHPSYSVILSKNPALHLTFKNLCYITRLEVYMVNSPSQLNSRPAVPSPLAGSVRHTFPLPRTGTLPARGGDGSSPRSWMLQSTQPQGMPRAKVALRNDHQGPIKAKSPVIVHNQGISRHPLKSKKWAQTISQSGTATMWQRIAALVTATRRGDQSGVTIPHPPSLSICPTRHPNSVSWSRFSPIKAKTPAIVHDQASSRQTQKKPNSLGRLALGDSLELGNWSFPLPPAPFSLNAFFGCIPGRTRFNICFHEIA